MRQWLPDGKRHGHEWIAKNPRRNDRRLGSFCVNLDSGKWADFALNGAAQGGDLITPGAYLHDLSQADSARAIAVALGVDWRRQ